MSLFELHNFSFTASGKTLFNNVTLHLEQQQTLCIETAVLDGGTTLLKCCAGIYQPSGGKILLEGKPIDNLSVAMRFKSLTYCYELGGLISSFSIYDNIAFPLLFNDVCKLANVKNRIYKLADALDIRHILALEIHQINDVQMRLLNLLRALCIQPKVIFIDEIQSGMSDNMIKRVIDVLKQQQNLHGFSIVLTTTGGDQIDFADRIFKIENKKIIEF